MVINYNIVGSTYISNCRDHNIKNIMVLLTKNQEYHFSFLRANAIAFWLDFLLFSVIAFISIVHPFSIVLLILSFFSLQPFDLIIVLSSNFIVQYNSIIYFHSPFIYYSFNLTIAIMPFFINILTHRNLAFFYLTYSSKQLCYCSF